MPAPVPKQPASKSLDFLVVDDTRGDRDQILKVIRKIDLPGRSVETREAENSAKALEACKQRRPDVVVLDLQLDPGDSTGNSGVRLLKELTGLYEGLRIAVVSQVKDSRVLDLCGERGPITMHLKPFIWGHLVSILQGLRIDLPDDERFGTTTSIADLLRTVDQMREKNSFVPIHLTGETGSGKSLMAEEIHRRLGRQGEFIERDAGAIPDGLFESEVFGNVRNAFNGALDHRGCFALAHRGTLFLDEIASPSLVQQQKLLVCLKGGNTVKITPIGGEKAEELDVMLITATNHDLGLLCDEKRFSEPLYHRLTSLTHPMPPLRERLHEIPMMVEGILRRLRARGTTVVGIEPAAIDFLREPREWRGNVRTLTSVLEVALIRSRRGMIERAEVEKELARRAERDRNRQPTQAGAVGDLGASLSLDRTLAENELQVFVNHARAALQRRRAGGAHITADDLAADLGIARATFFGRLQRARDGDGLPGVDELEW